MSLLVPGHPPDLVVSAQHVHVGGDHLRAAGPAMDQDDAGRPRGQRQRYPVFVNAEKLLLPELERHGLGAGGQPEGRELDTCAAAVGPRS